MIMSSLGYVQLSQQEYHLSCLQKGWGCKSGFIINFLLSFTAALPGSLSMKEAPAAVQKSPRPGSLKRHSDTESQ